MYTYRLHLEDGSDAGTATYAVLVRPGEEILVGNGRRFRVLDVVPFDEEDESPFVGLLQVEAVYRRDAGDGTRWHGLRRHARLDAGRASVLEP